MPFHIHGSQMNGFPLPSSSHLSLRLSFPFFSPPPPSSHCSGQLPSITVTGRPQHQGRICVCVVEEGRRRRRRCVCIWMWWEEETVCDIPPHGICLQVCLCVCVCMGMQGCFRVCVICPWGNCSPHTMAVVATALWQQQFDICEG